MTTSSSPSSMADMRRSARGAGLPPNLYTHSSGLYRYKRPDTGTWHYVGRDRAAAIKAAHRLNALLTGTTDMAEQVLRSGIPTLRRVLELFGDQELPAMKLADKTRTEYTGMLRRMAKAAPDVLMDACAVRHAAETLKGSAAGNRAYNANRSLLVQVFRYAMAEGWAEANYAAMTRKLDATRERARLTYEAFVRIRDHHQTPQWFRGAMMLALQTLQRREDLCAMRWPENGILRVEQGKTGQRIEIEVGAELAAVIAECRDSVVSPYIIHRAPEKARPMHMRAAKREHFSQVLPEQLSRAFQDARDASGACEGIEHPPTLHEIRSLGMDLYRRAGWTDDQIQALAGHEDVEMTRHYLDGHDAPWIKVRGGLKIG